MMCGIVGFLTNRRFKSLKEALSGAVTTLNHRGPDDSGLFFDEENGVGLGHRRLSVIDLSQLSNQPMGSEDASVWIIYNGEVYNFRSIRLELENHGRRFKSTGDAEVVLKAYLEWGIDCVSRFVGMFAFAIWDKKVNTVYLVRDRMGIKPLYYYFRDGVFLFGSELKSLMAFPHFIKEVDPGAFPLYLHYQYIPAPRTIFRNTYKLLPGHFVRFNGGEPKCHAYWEAPKGKETKIDTDLKEQKYANELEHLLTQAVSDRLVSDVPLGALLSGGIDSSLVTALMQKSSTNRIQTFSIGFEENAYNEAPWAAEIADYLETDHTEMYVTAKEALGVIPKLPEIYDEPFADASAIPTCVLSKLARSQLTVALSGDGGDEQFAGYVRYWSTKEIWEKTHGIPVPVRQVMSGVASYVPQQWIEAGYPFVKKIFPRKYRVANFMDKWQKMVHIIGAKNIRDFYRSTISIWPLRDILQLSGREIKSTLFDDIFLASDYQSLLSLFMLVDQRTYLPDDLLTKVDRASMAVSLEVRVPLLDHRIIEFSSQLPDELKYKNGEGKYLLKKVLSRYLPSKMFDRPKMGFGVPIDHWLKNELKPMLLDYLSEERLRKSGLVDPSVVTEKIKAHLSGRAEHQYRLWALLMWEMWRERWLGN